MKTHVVTSQEKEQKSNEPLLFKKIKINKSHTHTLPLTPLQKIHIASKINPHSPTEDFLAADMVSTSTLIRGHEKRWAMDLTLKVLEAFNHQTFHGCIMFIEQRMTDDADTSNYGICCETFYFGDDSYQVSLPGKIYKTKTIQTNSYKYEKKLHEIASLKKTVCTLTHNITDDPASTLHLSCHEIAAALIAKQSAHLSSNTSALIVPLDYMDQTACLSAAIFTSRRENSIACDTSTFFYSIFKEALKIRNNLNKKDNLNMRESKRSAKSITHQSRPDATIQKAFSISGALEALSMSDSEAGSSIASSKSPVSCTNIAKETETDKYINGCVSYLQKYKNKLLLFKKIYHTLHTNQRGWKSPSFLEMPDALYLSVEYLEFLINDEETKNCRRQKAWALTKKYFSSDNNVLLQKEILDYSEENSSAVTEYFSKVSDIITAIPGLFSLFSSTPNSSSSTETHKRSNPLSKAPSMSGNSDP